MERSAANSHRRNALSRDIGSSAKMVIPSSTGGGGDASRQAAVRGIPAFLALIRELDDASPEFHRWCLRQDVNGFGEGLKRIRHAQLGEIEFEHNALAVENAPDLGLIIYTTVAGESDRKARRPFAE
jgi:hypothetical protein